MTAPMRDVSGARGISRGARNSVIGIAICLLIYGVGLGLMSVRANNTADTTHDLVLGREQDRFDACVVSKDDRALLVGAFAKAGREPPQPGGPLEVLGRCYVERDCTRAVAGKRQERDAECQQLVEDGYRITGGR